jgi:hypothetical protein
MRDDSGETLNLAGKPELEATIREHGTLLQQRLSAPAPAGLELLPR